MFKILGLLVILATIFGSCGQRAASPDDFGKKLKFSKNVPLELGEITITFIEKRTTISDMIVDVPSVATHYFDFRIQKDGVEKTMSWTVENGILRPWRFELNGQRYEMELRRSDKLGRLAEDEIVVWKK